MLLIDLLLAGPILQQHLRDPHVPAPHGRVQGGVPREVRRVDVGAPLQQREDDELRQLPRPEAGHVERRVPVLELLVGVDRVAAEEDRQRDVHVALPEGRHQGGPPGPVAHHPGGVLEKNLGALEVPVDGGDVEGGVLGLPKGGVGKFPVIKN